MIFDIHLYHKWVIFVFQICFKKYTKMCFIYLDTADTFLNIYLFIFDIVSNTNVFVLLYAILFLIRETWLFIISYPRVSIFLYVRVCTIVGTIIHRIDTRWKICNLKLAISRIMDNARLSSVNALLWYLHTHYIFSDQIV